MFWPKWTEFCVQLPVLYGVCPGFRKSPPTCEMYCIGWLSQRIKYRITVMVSHCVPQCAPSYIWTLCGRSWQNVGSCVLLRGVSCWSLGHIQLLCSEMLFLRLWVHRHGLISPLSWASSWWPTHPNFAIFHLSEVVLFWTWLNWKRLWVVVSWRSAIYSKSPKWMNEWMHLINEKIGSKS